MLSLRKKLKKMECMYSNRKDRILMSLRQIEDSILLLFLPWNVYAQFFKDVGYKIESVINFSSECVATLPY